MAARRTGGHIYYAGRDLRNGRVTPILEQIYTIVVEQRVEKRDIRRLKWDKILSDAALALQA